MLETHECSEKSDGLALGRTDGWTGNEGRRSSRKNGEKTGKDRMRKIGISAGVREK